MLGSNMKGNSSVACSMEWDNTTYSKLFCRRCFKYDCQTHGTCHPQPHVREEAKSTQKRDFNCPSQDDQCYLNQLPSYKHVKRIFRSLSLSRLYKSFIQQFDKFSGHKKKAIVTLLEKHLDGSLEQPWLHTGGTLSPAKRVERILECDFCIKSIKSSEGGNDDDANDGTEMNRVPTENNSIPEDAIPFIRKILAITGGNICQAAQLLGNYWDTRQKHWIINCSTLFEFVIMHGLNSIEGFESNTNKGKNRRRFGRRLKSNNTNNLRKRNFERSFLHTSFEPCDHDGSCSVANGCRCVKLNLYCEKYCACSKNCSNRFQGCGCKFKCNTRACVCFAANRECDPDKCHRCTGTHNCANCHSIWDDKQPIVVGHSSTHGWGVFATTFIRKGSYVYPYLGELISQNEADRRGKIYDKLKCSFLFNLNEDQVIDATRKGNKLKYANHSQKFANMKPKVVLSHGDHCVQMYAIRDIKPGEELRFDYGYGKDVAPIGQSVALEK